MDTSRRRIGAPAPVAVPLMCSTYLLAIPAALAPDWTLLPALLLAIAGTVVLVRGAAEDLWVRAVYRARALTDAERAALAPTLTLLCRNGIGPPRLQVYSTSGAGLQVRGAGRRSLIVPGDLVRAAGRGAIAADRVAVLMAHAGTTQLTGGGRWQAAVWVWTLPYRAVAAAVTEVARAVPLLAWVFALGWRIRFVTFGIAIWQTWPVQPAGGLFLAAMLAATYYQPWAVRRHDKAVRAAGDAFVVEHGLGPQLLAMLGSLPASEETFERMHAIRGQLPAHQLTR